MILIISRHCKNTYNGSQNKGVNAMSRTAFSLTLKQSDTETNLIHRNLGFFSMVARNY